MSIVRRRYGVGCLLTGIGLVAATLAMFRALQWQTSILWAAIGIWVGFGYVAGWATSRSDRATQNVRLCAGISIVLNWLLWYANNLALTVASEAENEFPLAEVLREMIDAKRVHCFKILAIMATLALAFAGWKRQPRLLTAVGSGFLVAWFLVIFIGYVVACASLCNLTLATMLQGVGR